MCRDDNGCNADSNPTTGSSNITNTTVRMTHLTRRSKRDKDISPTAVRSLSLPHSIFHKKRQSKSFRKHKDDRKGGGLEALLPSLVGVAVLVISLMAKFGFRGRASMAGIDLGTTNSVVCVQQQSSGEGDLQIECVLDPATGSPVVPSVVSFLDSSERQNFGARRRQQQYTTKKDSGVQLIPPPWHTVVGAAAKRRIDSHPHHTLYNAKRVIGRSATNDPAVIEFQSQVEFGVVVDPINDSFHFTVPDTPISITAPQVGAYIVHYLMELTASYLGYDNVRTAVICVPAKFDASQRQATVEAFRLAGVHVTRIVEEPTAAALAYGLHRKKGVDHILVYDFGGGTLDISLLHVTDGFVDVMGSDGDDRLGGADFDKYVADHLLAQQRANQQSVERVAYVLKRLEVEVLSDQEDLEDILSHQCPVLQATPLCTASSFYTIGEQLKIALSEKYQPETETTVTALCLSLPTDMASNEEWTIASFCNSLQPITLQLTSTEYSHLVQPLFDRSIIPITRLLNDLNLQPADIDEIVMVGGTTRMPQIRQLVGKFFGDAPLNTHIDPDITVAYGAASVID